jgi:DNA-binding transcriptional ArsR family regulator
MIPSAHRRISIHNRFKIIRRGPTSVAGLRGDVRAIRRKLFEYMRRRVLLARGNVVSFTLRKIKRALGVEEDRSAGAEIKAVLEALAKRGLVRVDRRGRAPRYAVKRGSRLWRALIGGVEQAEALLEDEE